jgi:hypothetical protein
VRQTEYSHHYYTLLEKYALSSSGRKSRLCVSIKTVEVAFFVTELQTLQILGVQKSFEAFLTIYLGINNYTKYLIHTYVIKLSLVKKSF